MPLEPRHDVRGWRGTDAGRALDIDRNTHRRSCHHTRYACGQSGGGILRASERTVRPRADPRFLALGATSTGAAVQLGKLLLIEVKTLAGMSSAPGGRAT